jgi:hypothetical protein
MSLKDLLPAHTHFNLPRISEAYRCEHVWMPYVKYKDKSTVSNTVSLVTQLYALC